MNRGATTDTMQASAFEPARSRGLCAGLLIATITCGLASRRYANQLPALVGTYAGDVFWAAMVFWIMATASPRSATWQIAFAAMALATLVEVCQLYHAPWIDELRGTMLGGLALGRGFLWSDLVCYAAGVAVAALADLTLVCRQAE